MNIYWVVRGDLDKIDFVKLKCITNIFYTKEVSFRIIIIIRNKLAETISYIDTYFRKNDVF